MGRFSSMKMEFNLALNSTLTQTRLHKHINPLFFFVMFCFVFPSCRFSWLQFFSLCSLWYASNMSCRQLLDSTKQKCRTRSCFRKDEMVSNREWVPMNTSWFSLEEGSVTRRKNLPYLIISFWLFRITVLLKVYPVG